MKVYISRDEDCDLVWVWKKPNKGSFKPLQLRGCELINYQRIDNMDEWESNNCYHVDDFKKKFGISIRQKTLKCVHLPDNLVNSDEGKMFTIGYINKEKIIKATKEKKENEDYRGKEDENYGDGDENEYE
jgi:hypothetical protein